MLRAVARAGPYIEAYDIRTGDTQWDAETIRGLKEVVAISNVDGEVFDEGELFQGNDAVVSLYLRSSPRSQWLSRHGST